MTEDASQAQEKPQKKRSRLLLPLAVAALGGGGFASTWLGIWSPLTMISDAQATARPAIPQVDFVTIPTIEVPIPGGTRRSVVLTASIETDAAERPRIEHLMPRISDSFTGFLTKIDAAAYEKRGVLEVIRAELLIRSRFILGEDPVKELLITEFRIK